MSREKIRHADLTIEKNREGFWVISAIVLGHYVRRRYAGWSKRTCASMFLKEMNGDKPVRGAG